MTWTTAWRVFLLVLAEPEKLAWQIFRLLATAHVLLWAWTAFIGEPAHQAGTAQLEGVITDQGGHGVSARIEIWPRAGFPYQTVSDGEGGFRATVVPGTYHLVVERCAAKVSLLMLEVTNGAVVHLPALSVPQCHSHADKEDYLVRMPILGRSSWRYQVPP